MSTPRQNLDYAPSALNLSRRREEHHFGDARSRHVLADLLNLNSLSGAVGENSTHQDETVFGSVAGVLDKGTADSISTCSSYELRPQTFSSHLKDPYSYLPAIRRIRVIDSDGLESGEVNASEADGDTCIRLGPVEMLSYNLATVAAPGAIWAVQSYSSSRFDFLQEEEKSNQMPPCCAPLMDL